MIRPRCFRLFTLGFTVLLMSSCVTKLSSVYNNYQDEKLDNKAQENISKFKNNSGLGERHFLTSVKDCLSIPSSSNHKCLRKLYHLNEDINNCFNLNSFRSSKCFRAYFSNHKSLLNSKAKFVCENKIKNRKVNNVRQCFIQHFEANPANKKPKKYSTYLRYRSKRVRKANRYSANPTAEDEMLKYFNLKNAFLRKLNKSHPEDSDLTSLEKHEYAVHISKIRRKRKSKHLELVELSLRTKSGFGLGYHFYPPGLASTSDAWGGVGPAIGVIDFVEKVYFFDFTASLLYMGSAHGGFGVRFGPDKLPVYHLHTGIGMMFGVGFIGVVSNLHGETSLELGAKLFLPVSHKTFKKYRYSDYSYKR